MNTGIYGLLVRGMRRPRIRATLRCPGARLTLLLKHAYRLMTSLYWTLKNWRRICCNGHLSMRLGHLGLIRGLTLRGLILANTSVKDAQLEWFEDYQGSR